MKSKKKKAVSKTKFFNPTFNRIIVILLVLQFLLILVLGLFLYSFWDIYRKDKDNDLVFSINNSINELYKTYQKGITNYGTNATIWPEYGLSLPYNYKFGSIYIDSYPDENGKLNEFQITNDSARWSEVPSASMGMALNNHGGALEKFFEEYVPYIQACTRDVIAIAQGLEMTFQDDYNKLNTLSLNDGRVFDIYSNTKCQYEQKEDFLNHLNKLQSL